MLRRIAALLISLPALLLLWFTVIADRSWFERHVVVPAYRIAPPVWTLPALRVTAGLLGLALMACAAAAARRATPGGAVRVAIALLLAVCASELVLRHFQRPEAEKVNPRLEWILGVEDPRTGWAFVPNRTMVLPPHGTQRRALYAIDAHGDRAPSQDWVEDPEAPTILITGESMAVGHGLDWNETFAARLAEMMHVQVVNVAEGGYGSDQAHLRAVDALPRFAHPLALVTLVLPVQLHRNIQDDRSRLAVRDGALVVEPAFHSRFRLRQVFVDEIPYLSEARLQRSLRLTRAILHATADAARARGARPLFVVPSIGPPRPPEARPEAFVIQALLDDLPHVVVDIDAANLIPYDGHPGPAGARQIAEAIASSLGAFPAPGAHAWKQKPARGC
jgi:hypothetical protein